ncbi:MAG: hypothetical protein ABH881_00335 [bacterium]
MVEEKKIEKYRKSEIEKIDRENIKDDKIERPVSPEHFDLSEERADEEINKIKEGKTGEEKAGGIISTGMATRVQKERLKEIEDILSDGMDEAYLRLAQDKQTEFKVKGEETAKNVNNLLGQAKVKAQKIIKLIKKWLSVIPGVNKFFLEQEAKIKADKLIKIGR